MRKASSIIAIVILVGTYGVYLMMGDGGFKRMITISGVYSICKPDGYEVVCFLDADGKDGGMFCLPLSTVGEECKK